MAPAIDRFIAAATQQEELTEQFKSNNALLQNSLAHFRLFSARLSAPNGSGPLTPAVSALSRSYAAADTRHVAGGGARGRGSIAGPKTTPSTGSGSTHPGAWAASRPASDNDVTLGSRRVGSGSCKPSAQWSSVTARGQRHGNSRLPSVRSLFALELLVHLSLEAGAALALQRRTRSSM